MQTTYEIEICDCCGAEFETGYWRNDRTLCAECLPLEEEFGASGEAEDHFDDDDDWDFSDSPFAENIGAETNTLRY